MAGTSVGLSNKKVASRCTNLGTGSSSVLMPPTVCPDSSCKEVKVPHSCTTMVAEGDWAGRLVACSATKISNVQACIRFIGPWWHNREGKLSCARKIIVINGKSKRAGCAEATRPVLVVNFGGLSLI